MKMGTPNTLSAYREYAVCKPSFIRRPQLGIREIA